MKEMGPTQKQGCNRRYSVRSAVAGDIVDEMCLVYFASVSRKRGEHSYAEFGKEVESQSVCSAHLYTGTRTKDR
jgi:hypothetical protein